VPGSAFYLPNPQHFLFKTTHSIIAEGNMDHMLLMKRITFNKDVLCGKPLIRNLRISVEMILELLAKGASEQEILEDYPELEPEDLRAALLYAHHMVAQENIFDREELH